MKSDINQIYQSEITLHKNNKIDLSDKGFGYVLRFKPDKEGYYKELEVRIVIANQKTLTTTKPTYVTLKSYQTIEDIGEQIQIGDKFTILDINGKLGKGEILEIIQQQ